MNMKYLSLAVFFLSLAARSTAFYWPCLSNSDCLAEDSACSTLSGTCQCANFQHVFSEDYTKCLASSLIGEECSSSVQCNLMPTGASCNSGICACTDEQKYVHGQCRVVNSLDESCATDLDCDFGYDRESVQCKNNICECADGYYRRNGNICRRKSMEINDACVVNEDCQDLGTNIECKSLRCQIAEETISSKIDEAIATDILTNVPITKNNQFTQSIVNGVAQSAQYSRSEDSTISASFVQKSREIAVQTSIELLPIRSESKYAAHLHKQTNNTSNFWPNNRYRYYRPTRFENDDKTLSSITNTDDEKYEFGSSCTNNKQPCSGLFHSVCSNNVCVCQQGYYSQNGKCFAELGETAESAEECEHVYDTNTKRCLCQKNYFYESHLRGCRKPISFKLSCTADSQCSPFGAATCPSEIPRRCTCAQYAEYDEMRQMCVYKSGLGAQCQSNEGCVNENSFCSESTCVCNANYYAQNGECIAGLNSICMTDDECNVEFSECKSTKNNNIQSNSNSNKTCQCRKGYVTFGNNECFKEAEELEDPCVESEQCAPLLATCLEKKCSCGKTEHFKYGRCQAKKALGEACDNAGQCYLQNDPENVECRNSVCKCKFGYSANNSNTSCIRVVPAAKNSSGRPSALKIITFALIGSAFLITTAALKQAYYY